MLRKSKESHDFSRVEDVKKTGRHFPLITEMLNQLKEEIKE